MKNKFKLIDIIPFSVLFLSPWVHSMAHKNLILAIPDASNQTAHWIVGSLSVVGLWIWGVNRI